MSDPRHRALAEAALEVSRARARKLEALRRALLDGDEAEALRIARVVTGLEDGEAEGERTEH